MPKGDLSPEEELAAAYGESLLQALVATYRDWRQANAGKCRRSEVAHALLYFMGGCLAELGHDQAVRRHDWPSYVADCQSLLGEAMAFCRELASLEGPPSGSVRG